MRESNWSRATTSAAFRISHPEGPPGKRCRVCRQEKPLDCFPRHTGSADGFATRCRACHTAATKASRAKAQGTLPPGGGFGQRFGNR